MPRQRAGTTARGYGYQHQQRRQAALRAHVDGSPCPHCGLPMWRTQKLDLDHTIPMAHGGRPDGPRRLTHASCNRAAGARIVNERRAAGSSRRSRVW